MTNQVFKNLGKYMSYEEQEISPGKPVKINIKYTQPTYQDPKKVWTVGIFEDKISEALLEKIVGLSSGEEICVHTQKNDRGYSELVDITDKSQVPQKKSPSSYTKGGGYNNSNNSQGDGAQIGNALNNAAAILGTGHTVAELETTAWEIIEAGERLKAKLESKRKGVSTPTAAAKPSESKPVSKLEAMKAAKSSVKSKQQESTDMADLNDVEFPEDEDDIPY